MAGAATEERTARQSWGLQAALVTAEPVSVRERPAERDFSLVSISHQLRRMLYTEAFSWFSEMGLVT